MTEKTAKRGQKQAVWGTLCLVLLAPVLIPLIVLHLMAHVLLTIVLHVLAWLFWNTRGIRILYVYSDSPHWQEYIEENILPRLAGRSIVLNWSERKKWTWGLSTLVFHHFGGYRNFNPIAILFRPFRPAKIFRFFRPFRDLKHGKPDALHKMEAQFFTLLDG